MKWARNNCTKDIFKTLKITIAISILVIVIIFMNFKPVYKVILAGETIGFVSNKELVNEEINKYANDITGNIIDKQIIDFPEYKFQFISRNQETDENKVIENVEENTITTYKTYVISFNGEQKAIIDSQEEADNIINELKKDLNEEIELNFDITEIHSKDFNVTSKEDTKKCLNEIKLAKVAEYETKKLEEEAAQKEAKKAAQVVEQEKRTNSSWRLEIPKIGLSASIVEGTSAKTLNQYIGHFSETLREGGNIGLAAHNRGYNVNYFANIKNLVANDVIYYTYNGVTRTYTVVSQTIIEDTNWMIFEQTGVDKLTLMTCVDNSPNLRLCVQAVRSN